MQRGLKRVFPRRLVQRIFADRWRSHTEFCERGEECRQQAGELGRKVLI